MNALEAFLGLCLIAAGGAFVPPDPTCPPVYNPVTNVTINGCCNYTEMQDNLQKELNDIKGLLNTIIDAPGSGSCCPEPESGPTGPEPRYYDCYDVQQNGVTVSGVYTIQPNGSDPFEVYCDMDTKGGGWTVFQRRQDGSENFYRRWNDYKNGFGSLEGEHWLGNDNLHYLTTQKTYCLRVDLADFDDARRFAEYNSFEVAHSKDKYRLQLGSFSIGDAGDAMSICDDQQFSTIDQDNDSWKKNCAVSYKGGWWYERCHYANLNGPYLEGEHSSYADGVNWQQWRGYYYSLKFTEMKLRPV